MSYHLLTEVSTNIDVLTEQSDSGKQLYIEGVFAQANIVNQNKRFYETKVMDKAVNSYIKEYVDRRRALGELNHPSYPLPDPAQAAIRITELRWTNENDIYGKAIVLNTPKGNTVRGLLEGGFALGVSTRALGSLKEKDGINYVQEDLNLTAIDCVDNPSAPNAYVNSIMESRWQINESGVWVSVKESIDNNCFDECLFFERLEKFIKQLKNINK